MILSHFNTISLFFISILFKVLEFNRFSLYLSLKDSVAQVYFTDKQIVAPYTQIKDGHFTGVVCDHIHGDLLDALRGK
jgi:hypothetical protein